MKKAHLLSEGAPKEGRVIPCIFSWPSLYRSLGTS